jgi:hypothetical protein
MDWDKMSNLYNRGPPIDASYQVSVHWAIFIEDLPYMLPSSIKIAHFVPIHWQAWPPQAILVSDWLISKNLHLWNRLAKLSETW